jgi:hypothetical protein
MLLVTRVPGIEDAFRVRLGMPDADPFPAAFLPLAVSEPLLFLVMVFILIAP